MVDITTEIMQFVKQNLQLPYTLLRLQNQRQNLTIYLLSIVLFKSNFESTYFLASFLNVLALNMSVILGRS